MFHVDRNVMCYCLTNKRACGDAVAIPKLDLAQDKLSTREADRQLVMAIGASK